MPALNKLARAAMGSLAVAPFAGYGGTLDYSLYSSIQHSDNITLSADAPVGQYVLIPGLEFKYLQQGSVLQANVAGNLEYSDYLGNRFDSQTRTQLAGQVNWTVLPQRLDFSVQDNAGVQPVNSLASNSPDNQQQTNVLSLGPTLHFRVGTALNGQVELRYFDSYASKTDEFNSERGVAAVRLFRELNPTDQLSANVETQHVTFDSNTASDYDRNELYVGYNSQLAMFDANVVMGWSQLHFSHAPSDSSPLARVTLGWRPTRLSTFTLAGVYQYADAAQDMTQSPIQGSNEGGVGGGVGVGVGGIAIGNAAINSDVYLERRLELTYSYQGERLTLSVAPVFSKLAYLNDPTFDQTLRGGVVSVGYRLRPTLTLSAFGSGERLDYTALTRRDRTIRGGLNLNRQWNSHWTTDINLARQIRHSTAAQQSYGETSIIFSVVYRP